MNCLPPGPTLTVDPLPLIAGHSATFTLTNGNPDAPAALAYSLTGLGSTYIPQLNVTMDLDRPRQADGLRRTDANGETAWNLPVPAAGAGRTTWLQVVQYELKTNVVTADIN